MSYVRTAINVIVIGVVVVIAAWIGFIEPDECGEYLAGAIAVSALQRANENNAKQGSPPC